MTAHRVVASFPVRLLVVVIVGVVGLLAGGIVLAVSLATAAAVAVLSDYRWRGRRSRRPTGV